MSPDRSSHAEPNAHREVSAVSYCVVGSGPAGVACAKALLDGGAKVRMLDAGITLEPDKAALVKKLTGRQPADWDSEDLEAYRRSMNPDVGGVPLKLVYGSDFAYRDADEHLGTSYDNSGLRPSFAKGGLSNVWGAAMMPYLDRDLSDWPFGTEALNEHYAAVLRFTGLAATRDRLATWFPLHTDRPSELRPSRQAERLLAKMEIHRDALHTAGIFFGRSRVAVRGNNGDQSGCVYCRLCMHGCPYDHIYSSAHTVDALKKHPNFLYEPGVVVTSAKEAGGIVTLSGYERATRKPLNWECNRVFLAAGTIATTRILLRSMEAYDQPVWLKDSQYFLVPLLLTRKVKGAGSEWLHGLSQVFLEFIPSDDRPTAHLQIYSNSDLVNQAVSNTLGPIGRIFGFTRRGLQDRLLIGQGFLHSSLSSRIRVALKKDAATGKERLELKGEVNPAAKTAVRRLVNQLVKQARHLGAIAIPPMLKIAEPGRSFHSGGTFPMRKEQGQDRFETDLLGRVPGWQRIHAVDSTVFPSIPATTISFSSMANAHRIGMEAVLLDLSPKSPAPATQLRA